MTVMYTSLVLFANIIMLCVSAPVAPINMGVEVNSGRFQSHINGILNAANGYLAHSPRKFRRYRHYGLHKGVDGKQGVSKLSGHRMTNGKKNYDHGSDSKYRIRSVGNGRHKNSYGTRSSSQGNYRSRSFSSGKKTDKREGPTINFRHRRCARFYYTMFGFRLLLNLFSNISQSQINHIPLS